MILLRLRVTQVALAVLLAVTPTPYRGELERCFNRLDDVAARLRAAGPAPAKNTPEALQ